MLTYKQYKYHIKEIKKFAVQWDVMCKYINFDIVTTLESPYVKLIEDIMEDTSQWTSWFIYENDFGKKGLEAGFDGKMLPITTIKQAYNLIITKNDT